MYGTGAEYTLATHLSKYILAKHPGRKQAHRMPSCALIELQGHQLACDKCHTQIAEQGGSGVQVTCGSEVEFSSLDRTLPEASVFPSAHRVIITGSSV